MLLITVFEAFSSLGLTNEVIFILHKKIKDYKKLGRILRRKIISFIAQGHYLNSAGLAWSDYLYKEGYSYPAIYLSHRLASLGITTHYFSLLAEACSTPLLQYDYTSGLKSLSSFFQLRLSLAILSELERVDLPAYLEEKLTLTSEEDIRNLPPLIVLLLKASLRED